VSIFHSKKAGSFCETALFGLVVPVDFPFPILPQKRIDLGEGLAAVEATIGAERTGMDGF
jgi:hypothetical protein